MIVYPRNTVTYLRNNQAVSWPGFEPATASHKSNVLTITPPSHPKCLFEIIYTILFGFVTCNVSSLIFTACASCCSYFLYLSYSLCDVSVAYGLLSQTNLQHTRYANLMVEMRDWTIAHRPHRKCDANANAFASNKIASSTAA